MRDKAKSLILHLQILYSRYKVYCTEWYNHFTMTHYSSRKGAEFHMWALRIAGYTQMLLENCPCCLAKGKVHWICHDGIRTKKVMQYNKVYGEHIQEGIRELL